MSQEKQNPLAGVTIHQMFQDEIIDDNGNPGGAAGGAGEGEGGNNGEFQNQNPPPGDNQGGDDNGGQGDEGGDGGEGDGQEVDLFSQLNEEFGFEFEEKFEEDYDGIKGYIAKSSEELTKRQLSELFQQYPSAAEFFDFLANGGTEEQFFNYKQNAIDFSTLTINEGDEAMQERIIRMKLADEGFDQEEIQAKLDSYKSAVLLESEAKSALKILKKKDETRRSELIRQQQEEVERQEKEYQDLISSSQNIVNKGVLQNVQIPEKEKKSFVEFLFSPVDKTGKTKRDLVRESLTLEQKLELEYLVYKGLKLSDVIVAKKRTQDLAHLRKNADKENAQNQRSGRSAAQQKVGGIPEGTTLKDLGL